MRSARWPRGMRLATSEVTRKHGDQNGRPQNCRTTHCPGGDARANLHARGAGRADATDAPLLPDTAGGPRSRRPGPTEPAAEAGPRRGAAAGRPPDRPDAGFRKAGLKPAFFQRGGDAAAAVDAAAIRSFFARDRWRSATAEKYSGVASASITAPRLTQMRSGICAFFPTAV